ncbi:MAG: LutB/LldF family L-lactate oxidation iron-sulfur protein [Congregibacter sp.]
MNGSGVEFQRAAAEAIADTTHSANREQLGRKLPEARKEAIDAFGGDATFDAMRRDFKQLREHAQRHLGHYLEQFVAKARENGCQVHFARDSDELNRHVLDICIGAKAERVIKGKSMVTEETGLNVALEDAGLAVRETDLGEYILQEAGEKPSHIVAPALHKTKADIRELFLRQHALGERDLESSAAMVAEARRLLREDFLHADVGIIGSNALIAETGHSLLVTNEGNGDLCANLPDTLVICTTLDRLLPRASDGMAMLRLLARSTTGQALSCYTSFYSGPRKHHDVDGPTAVHFVILDNQRSDILASDYREMLHCLRCGACLNHCPIYMTAGGHAYDSVYPGPMGSVLTPLLTSLEEAEALPNACTACGRCEEVCPANIPLPGLLRDLRAEQFTTRVSPARWRAGLKLHAWLVLRPRLYRAVTGAAVRLMHRLGRKRGVIRHLPFAGGWLTARDLPAPAKQSFLSAYLDQQRKASRGAKP